MRQFQGLASAGQLADERARTVLLIEFKCGVIRAHVLVWADLLSTQNNLRL